MSVHGNHALVEYHHLGHGARYPGPQRRTAGDIPL